MERSEDAKERKRRKRGRREALRETEERKGGTLN